MKTFKIIISTFKVKDKEKKFYFFKNFFLIANLNINIVLNILFCTLSNLKINFLNIEIF